MAQPIIRSLHRAESSILAIQRRCKFDLKTCLTKAGSDNSLYKRHIGFFSTKLDHRIVQRGKSLRSSHSASQPLVNMSTTERVPDAPFFPAQYPEVLPDESDALSAGSDLLVILVPEEAYNKDKENEDAPATLGEKLSALDSNNFGGLLEALSLSHSFSGSAGSSAWGPWIGGKSKLVALVGLGKLEKAESIDSKRDNFREAGKQIAVVAKASKSKEASIQLWEEENIAAISGLSNGILLGGYEATRFKAKAKLSVLEKVHVHTSQSSAAEELLKGSAFAKGTLLSRYLVEAPANICTPTHLANAAQAIKDQASDVYTLEVLERDQCEGFGMGCYLGVAECSAQPPKFIHLTYKSPGDGEKKVIALIGKGLTFDSGGYNLKVGGMIEMMKFDMGGCGAILGAAHTLGQLKPPNLEVHFISASCENMIDGKGMRSGDVLTAANGKTVEINNTDAEGRLTLADALWFAQEKCGAKSIVDIATLTGAQMVALGVEISAVLSPQDEVYASLQQASKESGEQVWRLPLQESYFKSMKSHIADMKNSGGRFAGTITAGLFLKQYVDTAEVNWAHIDIAGPAWAWGEPGGATGYGSSLLAQWAINEGRSPQS